MEMSSWSDWHLPVFSGIKSDIDLDEEARNRVASSLKNVTEADLTQVHYETYQGGEQLRIGNCILSMKMLEKYFPHEREKFEPLLVLARKWMRANPRYVGVAIATLM
jgi:hypothetical protein